MILREAKPDLRMGGGLLALGGFAAWHATYITQGFSQTAPGPSFLPRNVITLMIPRRPLAMPIVVLWFIGSFSINLNPVDLSTMVGRGMLCRGMQEFGSSQAALCIAVFLGARLDSNLRRGLLQNDDTVPALAPNTLLLLGLTVLSGAWPCISGAIVRDRAAQRQ